MTTIKNYDLFKFNDDNSDLFGTDPFKLHNRNGPQTSEDAAYSVPSAALELAVLRAIHNCTVDYKNVVGAISDEVRNSFPPTTSYSSVTARYKALKDKGLIEIVGKRPGRSGRQQSVMVLTLLGQTVLFKGEKK